MSERINVASLEFTTAVRHEMYLYVFQRILSTFMKFYFRFIQTHVDKIADMYNLYSDSGIGIIMGDFNCQPK